MHPHGIWMLFTLQCNVTHNDKLICAPANSHIWLSDATVAKTPTILQTNIIANTQSIKCKYTVITFHLSLSLSSHTFEFSVLHCTCTRTHTHTHTHTHTPHTRGAVFVVGSHQCSSFRTLYVKHHKSNYFMQSGGDGFHSNNMRFSPAYLLLEWDMRGYVGRD